MGKALLSKILKVYPFGPTSVNSIYTLKIIISPVSNWESEEKLFSYMLLGTLKALDRKAWACW